MEVPLHIYSRIVMFALQFLKHSLASVFNQIEGKLEIALVSIIRVGNGTLAFVRTEIVGQPANLLAIVLATRLPPHIFLVLAVHHENIVKTVEILRLELACPAVEIIPTLRPTLAHTAVGQFTHMPRANASRVNLLFIVHPLVPHDFLHHALSGWRTANISQANKQQAFFHNVRILKTNDYSSIGF